MNTINKEQLNNFLQAYDQGYSKYAPSSVKNKDSLLYFPLLISLLSLCVTLFSFQFDFNSTLSFISFSSFILFLLISGGMCLMTTAIEVSKDMLLFLSKHPDIPEEVKSAIVSEYSANSKCYIHWDDLENIIKSFARDYYSNIKVSDDDFVKSVKNNKTNISTTLDNNSSPELENIK